VGQQLYKYEEILDTTPASLYKLNNMLRNIYHILFGNVTLENLDPGLQQQIKDLIDHIT